jgi:hypothetical protein
VELTSTARRVGIVSAVAVVALDVAYAVTLVIGLRFLDSPQQPIGDPMFTILEVLILAIAPAMVALMVAVHAWAPPHAKTLSLIAVVFMGLVAGVTCSLHFVVLTVSRQAELAAQPWLPLMLSFRWPSIGYALDILAWDVFFALSMAFAAPVFSGSRLAAAIRGLMIASAALSFAGLIGVAAGDMELRNIGIVGYVGVFVVVAALLAVLFHRAVPATPPPPPRPARPRG